MEPEFLHPHHGGFLEHEVEKLDPIPVRIIKDQQDIANEAADFGAWSVTQFITGLEGPRQILPQANKRKRAIIYILPGFVNNNTVGYVSFGSQSQMNAYGAAAATGLLLAGGILVAGNNVTLQSKSELWCRPDGSHSLTVVVIDERYQ